jgi:hypothetical protein
VGLQQFNLVSLALQFLFNPHSAKHLALELYCPAAVSSLQLLSTAHAATTKWGRTVTPYAVADATPSLSPFSLHNLPLFTFLFHFLLCESLTSIWGHFFPAHSKPRTLFFRL